MEWEFDDSVHVLVKYYCLKKYPEIKKNMFATVIVKKDDRPASMVWPALDLIWKKQVNVQLV